LQVAYVAAEDIPAEVYAREKEIEMGREDLANKPEAIRAKIAEGRVAKLAQEMALLPQPYLMDPTKTVEQVCNTNWCLLLILCCCTACLITCCGMYVMLGFHAVADAQTC
jgi:translation elongation factor EF-Ts